MKLTKKLESKILKVYNAYWEGYLKGDIPRMAALLDPKYTQVGSAETEVFFKKKDAVKFLHDTIDQVAGQLEMRKRVIRKELLEASVLINEQCDLYAKSGKKWIFFSKFRASTTLQEKSGKWKIIHQHSSFPDLRAQDGENIALEKVEEENVKLKDAIKRRTIELEEKNHELKIEVSLERVRARSMAMQKSDELKEVIQVVYDQFVQLKINVEHTGFIIDYKTRDEMHIWLADQHKVPAQITIPYFDSPHWNSFIEARKKRKNFFTNQLNFKEKNKFYRSLFKLIPGVSEKIIKYYLSCPGLAISTVLLDNVGLYIENFSGTPYTDEENKILIRFGKVFEQTYTRFLDLQKAEAQAREAQIETALEKIRSQTMAMQHSDELQNAATLLFQQVQSLGIKTGSCGFFIWIEDGKTAMVWNSSQEGGLQIPFKLPHAEIPHYKRVYEAAKKGDEFHVEEVAGKALEKQFNSLRKLDGINEIIKKYDDAGIALPSLIIYHDVFFKQGYLSFHTHEPVVDAHDIFKRFGKVFEQTYTRFLDLQKAEAQAREAQIEAAVERVRSQSMGMHHTDDLHKVTEELLHQLNKLSVDGLTGTTIYLVDANDIVTAWDLSSPGNIGTPDSFTITYDAKKYPVLGGWVNEWRTSDQNYFALEFPKEVLLKAVEEWKEIHPEIAVIIKNAIDSGKLTHQWSPAGRLSKGLLAVDLTKPPTEDTKNIVTKMAGAFNLAYQRFEDLQKAEAQAREATIEAALERVRSRSLAMHKSEELQEVVNTVSASLIELGVKMDSANFNILHEGSRDMDLWVANIYSQRIHVPYIDVKPVRNMMDARDKGINSLQVACTYEEKNLFWNEAFENTGFKSVATAERKKFILESKCWTILWTLAKHCGIQLNSYSRDSYTEEEVEIMKRFTNVFEQAYVRFLDLQKAEAQAREAQIEASLERVRGKAMSMHNSNDLLSTAGEVFTELRKLGIKPIRCGVGLLTKDSTTATLYHSISSDKGDEFLYAGTVVLEGHPAITEIYESANRGERSFPVLKGELLRAYYEKVLGGAKIPSQSSDYAEYGYFLSFNEGFFYGWSGRPIHDQEIKILNRFKAIIDLTFRRYIELQNAESNALEAIRSASLDRVRADIASMRSTADLDRITPLIWKELTTLGIPFIRCGVFIMDDAQEQIHTFLSTPDGKAIASFHLPYGTSNLTEAVDFWRAKKMYITHWGDQEFSALADVLVQQGSIATREQYLSTLPKEGIYLHYLPFLQGMLYVGNTSALHEDDLHLVQSVADAFATAYARYEDFNKLEAAKQQVDKTLVDLKQAQQQLVQSEKMASLGELTAGIAHEIQNPLNFVNNFSEVSNELIDEMKAEQAAGNWSLAAEIAEDVKQNMEKILHHGKRAEGIVKGMLQHSRSSSGVKEPTDINALCDEYLRLSYHGLRAKDKSFNAKFETDFDSLLPKINVAPQDMGRVVLNLINNAFYVVNERSKLQAAGYQPQVIVTTKKDGDKIFISVKDNGNGIPEHIKEKIFQPFFTTKPTGQGTGLGLSLSYDIVKAHGGELKVESKEGEGSIFIVTIES